jgi:regulator of protease activity HflC (stomatin/prohibitin superfamily)
MQMQVEAERRKRAQVLESEGVREAAINVAEGERQSRILASEAEKIEQINKAEGLATALKTEAEGKSESLRKIGERIRSDGLDAASLNVAEQYIKAFGQLARSSSTLILPKDAGNVSSMVGQAMQIYKTISNNTTIGKVGQNIPSSSEYYSDAEDNDSRK